MRSDEAHVIPNHGFERLVGFREPSFELIMKNYDEDILSGEMSKKFSKNSNSSTQMIFGNNPSITLCKNENSNNSNPHSYTKYLNKKGRIDSVNCHINLNSLSIDKNDNSEQNSKFLIF